MHAYVPFFFFSFSSVGSQIGFVLFPNQGNRAATSTGHIDRYAALACNTDVASLLGGLVKSLVLHSFRLVTFHPFPRSRGPHLPIRLSLKSLKFLLLQGKGRGREGKKRYMQARASKQHMPSGWVGCWLPSLSVPTKAGCCTPALPCPTATTLITQVLTVLVITSSVSSSASSVYRSPATSFPSHLHLIPHLGQVLTDA